MPDIYVLLWYGAWEESDLKGVYTTLERAIAARPDPTWHADNDGDWVTDVTMAGSHIIRHLVLDG